MANLFLYLDGEQKGPYFAGQVRSMLAEGTITNETLAWHEGLTEWSTVGAVLAALPVSGPPPVPPAPPPRPRPAGRKDDLSGWVWAAIIGGVVLFFIMPCLAGIALGPVMAGIEKAKENVALQRARQIAQAMFAYAADHDGSFPDAGTVPAQASFLSIGNVNPGASTSTEVFQKLLDGKYVTSPAVFYIAMPGKVPPTGDRLTAGNVCFDVTAGLTARSAPGVPLVYTTGFTLSYGQSIRVTRDGVSPFPGFIAFYTGNSGRFIAVAQGQSAVVSLALPSREEKLVQLRP